MYEPTPAAVGEPKPTVVKPLRLQVETRQRTQQDGEIGAASFRQNVYQNIAKDVTESM